jgi:hypothetical protein
MRDLWNVRTALRDPPVNSPLAALVDYGLPVAMDALGEPPGPPEPLVEWLEASLHDTAGQDPLGFNTITLDRILPQLLPGILQQSRARPVFLDLYSWMLWQYAERKRPAQGRGARPLRTAPRV